MGPHMSIRHAGLLHAANDIERVSDHARNIGRMAETVMEGDQEFIEEDLTAIREMYTIVLEIYETAIRAVRENTRQLAPKVKELAARIDAKGDKIRAANINRMAEGVCSAEGGIMVADIIANLERVGDHSTNISHLPRGKL